MIIKIIILILTYLLLGAHFFRDGETFLSIVCIFIPLLLLIKKKWCLLFVKLFTYGGVIVWIFTLITLINERVNTGEPWLRMAVILLAVIVMTISTSLFLNSKVFKEKYFNF